MSTQRSVVSERGVSPAKLGIFGAFLVGFVVTWILFITAPPDGLVAPFGMVISVIAGGYLIYLLYMYVMHPM